MLSQVAQLCLEFSFATALATALSGALCAQLGWRPWLLHPWLVSRDAWRHSAVERVPASALPCAEAAACVALLAALLSPAALLIAWAALLFARVVPPQYGAPSPLPSPRSHAGRVISPCWGAAPDALPRHAQASSSCSRAWARCFARGRRCCGARRATQPAAAALPPSRSLRRLRSQPSRPPPPSPAATAWSPTPPRSSSSQSWYEWPYPGRALAQAARAIRPYAPRSR
jgi:hypothetical protein